MTCDFCRAAALASELVQNVVPLAEEPTEHQMAMATPTSASLLAAVRS